jgi:hypothetical protein
MRRPRARKVRKKYGNRYPWDEWFERGSFYLVRGRDYECTTHGMAQMIRNVASSDKYRIELEIRIISDTKIYVHVEGRL